MTGKIYGFVIRHSRVRVGCCLYMYGLVALFRKYKILRYTTPLIVYNYLKLTILKKQDQSYSIEFRLF